MRIRSVVLMLASAGVAIIGGLELAFRLQPRLLPEGAQLELQWHALDDAMANVAHPYTGFLHAPNRDGGMGHRNFGFTYTTDEHGFRNPSPWPSHADIVVLGDSQAFGYGVEADQRWTSRLADRLPGRRLVNLGLNGGAPQQSLRIYELYGAALEPELILFVLFPGHAVNAVGRFDRWLEAGSPATYETWQSAGAKGKLSRAISELLRSSFVYMAARHIAGSLVFGHWGRTIEFDDGRRVQLAPILNMDTYRHLAPDHPNFREVLETVDRLRRLGEAGGADLLVLLIPTKEELYLPRLGVPTASTTEPFAAALEALDVRYIDVSPHFRERVAAGERLFFERDVHPNEAGCRLIAAVVSRYLRANQLEIFD